MELIGEVSSYQRDEEFRTQEERIRGETESAELSEWASLSQSQIVTECALCRMF